MPSSTTNQTWLPKSYVVFAMMFLCTIALCISGYLAWASFNSSEVAGCGGSAVIDCDHVLHSKYSKILGIPVSVPAFALYAGMLSVLVFFRKSASDLLLKYGWTVLTFGALSAAGAAVWFTGLQVAEWKFCPYCLGAHSCGLLLATIVLLTSPLTKSARSRLAVLAMTGVLTLVTIQWQSEEAPSYVVETFDDFTPTMPTTSDGNLAGTESFSAPVEFAAPSEFVPPVFAPPGMAVAETSEPSRSASLVPTPVDVTVSEKDASSSEKDAARTVMETPNLFVQNAGGKSASIKPPPTVASAGPRISVDYTPPMEVPVIHSNDPSDIQRVDFRTEDGGASDQEATTSERPDGTPATSKVDPKAQPKAQPAGESTAEPADEAVASRPSEHQASVDQIQTPKTQNGSLTSPRAMAYLFFSASGATNAAISDVLLLNAAQPTGEQDKGKAKAQQVPAAEGPKLVVVAGNRFSLNPKHWPLIGKPDADFIFVEMFDYTCPHCRVTNKAIEGAFREYGDRLAVLTLPVPLERSCNSTVEGAGKPGACEMAKLGVAVWRINQPKFADYHHYMCDSQRTVSDARAKAIELVGKEKLDVEMALPHAAAYIKKHVELYKQVGMGTVPKLMFPHSTMTGEIQQSSVLVAAIKRELDH